MQVKTGLIKSSNGFNKGFTLIETIVGIIVLALSFSLLTTLIFPIVGQSADQLHQIKAAELGQSLLNEIHGKAFDEQSDRTGGLIRCGETPTAPATAPQCTTNNNLTNEENGNRALFDDVDDYNGLILNSAGFINSFGTDMSDLYIGFQASVEVCNDGNYDGICSAYALLNTDTKTAKLIKVTITTPTGFDITFSTYRANY